MTALLPAFEDEKEYLSVEVGRPSGESWVTVAQATDPDEGIVDRVLSEAWSDPERPAVLAARDAFAGIAWQVVLPQIITLSRQRRIPVLDTESLLIDIDADQPARVAWDTREILVMDGDEIVGDPGVRHVDSLDQIYNGLVDWTVATLDPLVSAVKERVRVGRPALWSAVVDCFAWVGPEVSDTDPTDALGDLARFQTAARLTPLGMRIPLIEVASPTGSRLQVGRSKCCLYYKEPTDPAEEVPAHLGGPWVRYCTTCPLIPAEETIRRLRHRLNEIEEMETV